MTTRWGHVFIVYATGVVAAGQLGVVAPLVPALQQDLQLTLPTVGLILSAITLVAATLGLMAGGAVARLGYARAIGIGLGIMIAATAAGAAAESGAAMLAVRIAAGTGYVLIVVAAPSLMTRVAMAQDQPVALALWGTFVAVGIALAQALSGALVAQVGWRAVFLADAIVLAGMWATMRVALGRDGSGVAGAGLQRRDLSRSSLLLAVSFFCFALTFLAVAGLLVTFLSDQRGMATERAAAIVAATTFCGALGSLAAGGLMRGGISPWLLTGIGLMLSMALSPALFSRAVPEAMTIAASALSFAAGGLVPAATFASVPLLARAPRAVAPLNGLLAQTGSLGSLSGPPLMALWVDAAGWTMAPALLISVGAAGTLCVWASARFR